MVGEIMINPCKHGNKGAREVFLEFNPKFSEGHLEPGEGIRERASSTIIPTIRWSEPYLLNSKTGQLCNLCGEIV
jgi:hypothetical protein